MRVKRGTIHIGPLAQRFNGDGAERLIAQQLDKRVLHGTSRVAGAAAFRQFFGHGLLPKFRQPTIQLLVAEPTQCCFT